MSLLHHSARNRKRTSNTFFSNASWNVRRSGEMPVQQMAHRFSSERASVVSCDCSRQLETLYAQAWDLPCGTRKVLGAPNAERIPLESPVERRFEWLYVNVSIVGSPVTSTARSPCTAGKVNPACGVGMRSGGSRS